MKPATSGSIPVIYNPTAGGGRARKRRVVLERFASRNHVSLDWMATRHAGHATEIASQAAGEGHPLIFAFGGDGTYNEVARGLLGTVTAMGVLPAGTTSVLAYELEIPRPVDRALEALLAGRDRQVSVGSTDHGDIFLLMLSAGPDSMVLERLGPLLKKLGGRVGVAAQAVCELAKPQKLPRLTVTADGRTLEGGWAIVGNARSFAGPFHATPGADLFSHQVETVVHLRSGRLAVLPFLFDLVRGRHQDRNDTARLKTDSLRIDSNPGERLAYQVDGDVSGFLPVKVSMHPKSVTLRLPGNLDRKG